MQMAGLLQACSVQADVRHIEQLSAQLSQANGEVETLTTRLHECEQREVRSTLFHLSPLSHIIRSVFLMRKSHGRRLAIS